MALGDFRACSRWLCNSYKSDNKFPRPKSLCLALTFQNLSVWRVQLNFRFRYFKFRIDFNHCASNCYKSSKTLKRTFLDRGYHWTRFEFFYEVITMKWNIFNFHQSLAFSILSDNSKRKFLLIFQWYIFLYCAIVKLLMKITTLSHGLWPQNIGRNREEMNSHLLDFFCLYTIRA